MDYNELRERVDKIIAMSGDDEAAHSEEDKLHLDVINVYCPPQVRKEVARLSAADFARWCA